MIIICVIQLRAITRLKADIVFELGWVSINGIEIHFHSVQKILGILFGFFAPHVCMIEIIKMGKVTMILWSLIIPKISRAQEIKELVRGKKHIKSRI